jgi:hypothetical protein
MSTPTRYKSIEDYSPGEISERMAATRRGEPAPKFETDDYKQRRADALLEAGLEEEGDEAEKPLDELSPADIAARMKLPGRRFGADN